LPETATWDDLARVLAIEAGLADIRAGRVVEGEAVLRWLDSWDSENELPQLRDE